MRVDTDFPWVPFEEIEDAGINTDYFSEDEWIALRGYYDWVGDVYRFEDSYAGNFSGFSEDEALGEMCRELDEWEVPERFRYYMDWEKMGRDLRFGGEAFAVEIGYDNFAVFWNH